MHPQNQEGFEQSVEMGGTFGGTLYDSRDLKMLRFSTNNISSIFPNIGMLWPGGAIGYTGGINAQLNQNSFVSYKVSLNALNVNAGKVLSFPYRFTDVGVYKSTISASGGYRNVEHRFSTSVQTAEMEVFRHLRSNQLKENKNYKWVPSFTAGLGFLHFQPKAINYKKSTADPYNWYLGNGIDVSTSLRSAGTAGQTSVEGMSKYSPFALIASTGFSMAYKRNGWNVNAQLKGNITTTDYLDDFSRGTYAGGDYINWLSSLEPRVFTDPLTEVEMAFPITDIMPISGGSRAQNYMPDGYWQVQLSLSKELRGSHSKDINRLLETNVSKFLATFDKFAGEERLDSTWEVGAYAGLCFYDGRDLKYSQIAGIISIPSNLEFSEGLFIQKNTHQRFSWNLALQNANISYARNGGFPNILGLPNGKLIQSYNSVNDSTYVIKPYASNFFTRMSSIESNIYFHLRDYEGIGNEKFRIVPSIGLGTGLMNFTPYREISGLRTGTPEFLQWRHRKLMYVDLREVGSEGQHILPNGRAYSKWAGLYSASFQLSVHTKKWIYKVEVKSNMTTTDYLDDFGRGAWFGGNYSMWSDALELTYTDVVSGRDILLDPVQIATVPEGVNLFTPRATNNVMDGYLQFHVGLSRRF
jgi:hypothetical protein